MQTEISTTRAKSLPDYIQKVVFLFFPQKQKLKAEYRMLIGIWSHENTFYME